MPHGTDRLLEWWHALGAMVALATGSSVDKTRVLFNNDGDTHNIGF